jgi:prevent-host-death family protein
MDEVPETVKAEDARKAFAELLNATQWQGKIVFISRHGRVAGVLVPADWYEAHRDREPQD